MRAGTNLSQLSMRQLLLFDATAVGVLKGGAILVRPDGFVGFRADPADETTMDALDAHLMTYLIPHIGATYPRPIAEADAH